MPRHLSSVVGVILPINISRYNEKKKQTYLALEPLLSWSLLNLSPYHALVICNLVVAVSILKT